MSHHEFYPYTPLTNSTNVASSAFDPSTQLRTPVMDHHWRNYPFSPHLPPRNYMQHGIFVEGPQTPVKYLTTRNYHQHTQSYLIDSILSQGKIAGQFSSGI